MIKLNPIALRGLLIIWGVVLLGLHLTLLVGYIFGGYLDITWREAFQIVSVASGVFFMLALFVLSRLMGNSTGERVLIFLGIASLGLIQLFFGYVETYPA